MKSLTPKDMKWLEQTLAKLQNDVTILYFTEMVNCRHCRQEKELLAELADLSHKLNLEIYNFTADHDVAEQYGIDKVPAFVLMSRNKAGIRYYGMPSDFEFRMLLENMVRLSSGEPGLSAEAKERLGHLVVQAHLQILTTSACFLSAGAVRIAHQLAMESDRITVDLVNLEEFPELEDHYEVRAAPTVVVNEDYRFYGNLPDSEFIERILESQRTGGQ